MVTFQGLLGGTAAVKDEYAIIMVIVGLVILAVWLAPAWFK